MGVNWGNDTDRGCDERADGQQSDGRKRSGLNTVTKKPEVPAIIIVSFVCRVNPRWHGVYGLNLSLHGQQYLFRRNGQPACDVYRDNICRYWHCSRFSLLKVSRDFRVC